MAGIDWERGAMSSPKSVSTSGEIDWESGSIGSPPEKSSLARRLVGDTAVSAVKGAIGLTEVPVGIADLATGGAAGKALEGIGYRPKEAKAMLDEMYSPEQKAANKAVSDAEGFFGTAGTALQNPSTIGQAVVESAPLLLPGAAIARGVGAAGKIAPVVAGGIGEGAVGAGLAAEQMRQNSEDGTLSARQTGAALASGAGTAAFGIAGGKLAQSAIGKKLGLADVDTALAMSPAQRAAAGGIDAGIAKRIAGGAVSEGVLEELPQSMWEQAAQNYGEGKPIGEGVAEAGAMGALAGGVMGGGFNALQGRLRGTVEQQPPAQEAPRALPAPTYTGTPNDQTMAAEVERANQVAAAQANADAIYAERAAFEQERAPAKLPVTGPLSAAVNVGIDSGATSITSPANPRYEIPAQPRGSFSQQDELASLIGQERADVAGRRELAQLVGQERRDQERRIAEAADSRRALDSALADTDQRAAGVAAQESEAARLRLLDNILSSVSDTGNPARQFGNALRRAGYRNTDFTERERQVIQRFSDARAALRSPEATTVPAAPNELDAASLGIRERSTAGAIQGASGRDKVGEAVSLLSQGWKLALNKTLVSPTGKKRKLNAEEFAAVREARAKMINKTEAGNAATQVDAVSDQGRGDVAAGGIGNAQPVPAVGSGRGGDAGAPAPGMRAAGAVGNAGGAGSTLNAAEFEQVAQKAAQADGAQAAPAGGQVAIKNAEAAPAGALQQQKEPKNGMQEGRRQEEVAANQLQAEAAPKPANQTQIKRSSPIMRRDDPVGAIMRVTGGTGIAANMAQTIIGDKASQATKVRGLFQNAGTMDLDDTADLLRTQEGYDVRDGNHLAELIREQAAGNSVVSMERAERDAADNAEKEYRAAVNERAASMGLKRAGGKRTLQMVEDDIVREERRLSELEAASEREAIIAADAIDDAIGKDMTEADFMRWLSDDIAGTYTEEEIQRAEQDRTDRENARDEALAIADAEERAQGDSRQGNGNQSAAPEGRGTEGRAQGAAEGFSLTRQTNEQAAEQFARQQAGEPEAPTKEQADRERDAVPFSMQQQSQPKPQGVQTGLFTADGRVSSDVANDPSAAYTAEQRTRRDEYTKDIFGQDLSGASQSGLGAGRQQPSATAVRNVVATGIVPGEYATVAEPRKTGEIKSAFAQVGSAGQAAHVLAGMRKLPQEHFAVLVLDKDNKPISVLRLFAGATTQAGVYPEVVAKAVYETPGAASIWFAHNHPSGKAEPSNADAVLTAVLSKPFGAGTGIEVAGHVVIAQTRYVEMDAEGYKVGADAAIPAGARTNTIPVTERIFRKVGTMGAAITSPALAKGEVRRVTGGKTGVVFVNAQNEPVGFLPLSADRMQKLRDYEDQSGAKLLFGAAARSNATSAFIHFDSGVKSADAVRAAENVYRALDGNGIKVLDAFYRDGLADNGVVSMSERGTLGGSPGRNFESRSASPADAEFKATERAYGGREAFDRAKVAGNTKLNYRQWVQVRTPKFKEWFGDWEAAEANASFNAILKQVENGSIKSGTIIQLGTAGGVLNQFGIPSLKIEMTQSVLSRHMKKHGIGFDHLRDLAAHVQAPIAVFKSKRSADSVILLTEIQHPDGDLVVALQANKERNRLVINDIRSIHPKPSQKIDFWIDDGLLIGVDESRGRHLLSTTDRSNSGRGERQEASDVILFNTEALRNVSKVVDPETGEPMVVYHGTTADINEFRPAGGRAGEWQKALDHFKKAQSNNDRYGYMNFRDGSFFSPKPEYAGNYTGENSGVMYQAFILAKNPVYFDMSRKHAASGVDPNKTPDALMLYSGDKSNLNEIAVIDPLQIKSATGNNGNFDGGNPDIRESRVDQKPLNAQQKFALNIAQKTADRFRAEYAGAAALDIRVVYSRDEIPEFFSPSPYAEGVYHDREGIIYLVASNLPTRQRAWQVLMHETVGHYGLANMMGDKFSSLWETVLKRAASSQPLNYNPQPGEANYETVEAVRRLYPEASDEEIAQEVLARMAETMPNIGWFRMAMARIRAWLKNAAKAFGLNLEPTMDDVRALVEMAGYHVRTGANLGREAQGMEAAFASQGTGRQSNISSMSDKDTVAGTQAPAPEADIGEAIDPMDYYESVEESERGKGRRVFFHRSASDGIDGISHSYGDGKADFGGLFGVRASLVPTTEQYGEFIYEVSLPDSAPIAEDYDVESALDSGKYDSLLSEYADKAGWDLEDEDIQVLRELVASGANTFIYDQYGAEWLNQDLDFADWTAQEIRAKVAKAEGFAGLDEEDGVLVFPGDGVSVRLSKIQPDGTVISNEPSASAGSDAMESRSAAIDMARDFGRRMAGNPTLDASDPFAEENARLREQDKSLWSKAKTQLRRYLSPGGLLPQSVFAEKIKRDSEFQAVEFDIRHLIGGLERAAKSDFGVSFDKLSDAQMSQISEALAGSVPASLPDATKAAAVAMRQYIDGMSSEYLKIIQDKIDAKMERAIETGKESDAAQAINDIEFYEKIKGNIGRYVHRSYQAFDDPKWFEKVPTSVLNSARSYLKQGYVDSGETDAKAAQLAEVTLHEILKNGMAYDSMEAFIAESKLGAKDLSILMRRKEVPAEIRALLGEYSDTRLNFTKSATKMGRLIWNTRFLDRVRDIGMGSFFFEGKDRPPAATTQIAAEGSEVYSPLNGLWTFPEIAQAFKDAMGKEQMSDLYRAIVRANGLVKYGKTILAPTTAMRNWQSAMFFSLANGHFDLTQMKKSIAAFREQVSQKATGEDLKYLRHLKQLGVVYDTPYAGEMARLLEDARMEELLSSDKGDAVRWFRKANQMAQGFYAFGDDFWKIIGFENEKAGLMNAGLSLKDAEIEAAKRIRDTYPTYSMVGRGVQWLSRFPLAGTFVSFPAEIIRTSSNMLRTVASDLKSDNPKLRELGMRRAAGMAFVSAAFWALAALSKAMAGVDDDEEEAIRDLAPEWQKNSTFLFAGRDEKGNLRYFDMSFLDPYGYWKRPITAMMRNQPWEDSLASGLRGMLEPFLGADITAGAIFEAVANQKQGGGKVYKENDSAIDQAVDIANHLRKTLQPGFVGNIERITKAAADVRKPSGQPYSMEDELVALGGWRATTVEPKTALYYRSFEFTDALAEARNTLTSTLRDANTVSESDIEDAKSRAAAKQENAFVEMRRLIGAAESAGLSKMQVMQTMRLSNVSQQNIAALMQGRVPPVVVTPQMRMAAVSQARTMRGEEFANEVSDRYRMAMGL